MFNCEGAAGHVLPLLALARGLESAGHEVVFVTDRAGCRLVEARGFRAVPVEDDGLGADGDLLDAVQQTRGLERLRVAIGGFLQAAVPHAERILDVADDEQPTVLVRESTAWGAWVAGERLGLPVAMFDFTPPPTGFFADALGDLFNDLRGRFGLAPDERLESLDHWLTILGAPPGWFLPECFRPTTHLLQPPPDSDDGETLPHWFAQLPDRPTIYATLGTVFGGISGVLSMLIEALTTVDANVILTVGRNLDPATLGPAPSHIHIERYIPQSLVMGHCDAVVAHGGYGSLMGALRIGLPVVSIPLAAADNHLNAARVEQLGAGIAVGEKNRSVSAIREAIAAVLGDRSYLDAARSLATKISELPEFTTSVGLVEKLVATGEPVLAT